MDDRLRTSFSPYFLGFECSGCGRAHDRSAPRSVCESCGQPLLARYDLAAIRGAVRRDDLGRFGSDLWR